MRGGCTYACYQRVDGRVKCVCPSDCDCECHCPPCWDCGAPTIYTDPYPEDGDDVYRCTACGAEWSVS